MGWVAAALVGSAAIGAGATAYSASQAPDAPDPISYGNEYRKVLRTQLKFAPQLYAARAQYDPMYQALENRLLEQKLFGTPGGPRTEEYTDYVTKKGYWKSGSSNGGGAVGWRTGRGGVNDRVWVPESTTPVTRTRTVNDPASRGLVDILENDLAPAARRVQSADERARIESELEVMRDLGPEALAAMKRANPEQAALLDELSRQAQEELGYGARLDPAMRREVEQSVRAGQSARGMGYGPVDNYTEAMEIGEAGQARRDQRRAYAAGVVGLHSATYGDPYQRFFSRTSGAGGGSNFLAAAYGAPSGRSSFDPESPLAASIGSTNYNAAQAAYIGGQNNLNASIGSGVGLSGQLASAYLQYKRPNSGIGAPSLAGGTGLG